MTTWTESGTSDQTGIESNQGGQDRWQSLRERRGEQGRQGRTQSNPASAEINVGSWERIASASVGGLVGLAGFRRGGLVGAAMVAASAGLIYRGATGHCPAYEKLGVNTNLNNKEAPSPTDYFHHGIHVTKAYTINKPAAELFAYWRNFENLAGFMSHVEEIKVLDEKRSHWKVKGPAGYSVEWDAEIIDEIPNRVISWRSLAGADVASAGSVRFIDTEDRGTEVRVTLNYIPPAGRVGAAVAKLFGRDPLSEINEDLRRFKRLMETGEIATTEGQPHGTCSGRL
jgi:uncharacterized membrane protein